MNKVDFNLLLLNDLLYFLLFVYKNHYILTSRILSFKGNYGVHVLWENENKIKFIKMAEITLTQEQLKSIKNDMERVEILSDEEVNALAQKVNKAVNLPLIGEEKEFIVFAKIIRRIDMQMYQLLPNEYYLLVKDCTDGITKEEAIVLEERLTPLINNVVNIPVLSEKMEAKLISVILGLIIKAMVKGFKLEQAELAND